MTMLRYVRLVALALGFWIVVPLPSRAVLLAYDQFDEYTSGNLSGQAGGSGWAGNWTSARTVFTASPGGALTYAGLDDETGRGQVSAYYGAGLYRSVAPIGSGTLYFGALVKLWDANTGIRLIDMGGPDDNSVLIGQYGANPYNANTTHLFLDIRPEGAGVPGQVGQDTGLTVTTATQYWIAKIEFNVNGNLDDVRYFVNPANASDLENNVGANARINNTNIGTLHSFSFYVDDNSGFDFDEARLGTAAADMFGVVPEPATMGLVFLGAVGFLVRRRRARKVVIRRTP